MKNELIRQLEIACEALYNASDLIDDEERSLEMELLAFRLGKIAIEFRNGVKREQVQKHKNKRLRLEEGSKTSQPIRIVS